MFDPDLRFEHNYSCWNFDPDLIFEHNLEGNLEKIKEEF
jgi:hypothetical protein